MNPNRPRFSLVCVVGDAAAVLPAFIDSIESQTFGLDQVEIVLVEVGATDDAIEMLHYWAGERPGLVTLLNAPEDGPIAALNAGLAAARGTWVGFPDVHDSLDPDYLQVVEEFLSENPSTALVATNRLVWDAETGEVLREHPLRGLFQGTTLIDLTTSTWHFHDTAAAAFFPLDPILEAGLEFDVELPPSFAGGHFLARYLIEVGHPAVGFLRRARYLLRRRTPVRGTGSPPPFADARVLFDRGYDDLVRRAREQLDEVPAWLQRHLAFELTRFLDRAAGAQPGDLGPADDVDAFHARIAGLITAADLTETIEQAQFPVNRTTRLALVHGYRPESWVDDHILIDKVDHELGLARARYFFTGVAPSEQVLNGGVRSAPTHAKTRTLTYLGRAPLCERILWVPIKPELAITLSDEPAALCFRRPPFPITTLAPPAMDWNLGPLPGRVVAAAERHYLPTPATRAGWKAQRAVTTPKAQREFAGAWVFMDKVHAARDNAEALFTHVRETRPEINAYFVIEAGTESHRRLRKVHGSRVVAHGSHRWRVLMALCEVYLSSHADAAVLDPPALADFMRPRWRFVHLDHGVRKDDGSQWLGAREIDVLVATTTPEFASIAGDGNDYPFTSKEVVLAGMPRLDRLVVLDRQVRPEDRTLVLVAPSCRGWLVAPPADGSHRPGLDVTALESEFVRRWTELLDDPALADLCTQHGLTLTLLPHPNLGALVPHLALPDHVALVSYDQDDVQQIFARSRVLITDFSSSAFDLAYIDRPVVYLQFDAERMRADQPVLKPGYFSYQRDGFGPVTGTTAEAVAAISAALREGPSPGAPYAARIEATFGFRDDGCCERLLAAIHPEEE